MMRSLRTRMMLLALCAGVLPLATLGVVLIRNGQKSGETLLESELQKSITQISQSADERFDHRMSDLSLIAENDVSRELLNSGRISDNGRNYLNQLYQDAIADIAWVSLSNTRDSVVWHAGAGDNRSAASRLMIAAPILRVSFGVTERGRRIGRLDAALRLNSVIPDIGRSLPSDRTLLVYDREHTSLTPDSLRPTRSRFAHNGVIWRAVGADAAREELRIVLAAPITPYVAPFRATARSGAVGLLIVTLFSLAFIIILTRRMTRSLEELAAGADAVAAGDLDTTIEVGTNDEIGRVAVAFNGMTENLRRTLVELTARRSLAAVGEFAASLAHEIRNGHTSVRLDLQRAARQLDQQPPRLLVQRALQRVIKLDHTVTSSLRLARSGKIELKPISIEPALAAAVDEAREHASFRGVSLQFRTPCSDLVISGNAAALEQLFLNLLMNAVEAAPPGGVVEVLCEGAAVVVRDNGNDLPSDVEGAAFEPFFSTKEKGTGLGLAIARRIAEVHGATVQLQQSDGWTEARVSFHT